MLISRSYLSGVAAAALFIGLSVAPSLAKERESFEQTIPFNFGGTFSVENINGSITIETWNEGSVRIQAEKKADSYEDLQRIEIIIQGGWVRSIKLGTPSSVVKLPSRCSPQLSPKTRSAWLGSNVKPASSPR